MTDQILAEFQHQIDYVTIIPSAGGVFEVTVDGTLVHSKKKTGRHAEFDDVLTEIRGLVA